MLQIELPENAKSFLTDAVLTCLNPHQTTDEVKTSAVIEIEKLFKTLYKNKFVIPVKVEGNPFGSNERGQ